MKASRPIKKIKIIFIIDFIDGITGGTENQLVKLINNLDKRKYDLHLLCLRNTRWILENKRELECNVKTYNIIKLKDPINVFRFIAIVKYIAGIKPDIAMTFFPLSNILGVIASKLANVQVIVSTRRDYGLWLTWLTSWSIYLLRFANRFVKGIVTNSQRVKDLTSSKEKFDSSRIQVIYNGLDIEDFSRHTEESHLFKKKLGIPESSKIIGIVANLRPMKRHRTLIKAARQILAVRSDVVFVLVGDGPLRKELVDITAKFGIEEHVRFVGSQLNILPFLSIFNIGVNCSANEGLSNAIMEYMAYGVPCIVSRAGGNEELIDNGVNGYTFELDDDRRLAELIISLLKDKRKQKEFAAKSKEKILDQMSLNQMINEYDRYFSDILRAT